MEKNRLEKVRKHVFYKHTNIVTKKCGGKNARKMFLETHEYREKKGWKKIFWKKCENKFYYKHTNFETIKWEKNPRKNFFPKTRISRSKNDGKYRLEKVRNTFFINTRIS